MPQIMLLYKLCHNAQLHKIFLNFLFKLAEYPQMCLRVCVYKYIYIYIYSSINVCINI